MRVTEQQGSADRTQRAVKTAALGVSLVIGAYLLVLALASAEHSWLGWFTLFPLFCAIRVQRPVGAMVSGALWGLSLYLFLPTPFESTVASAGYSTWIHTSVLGLTPPLVLLTAIPAVYSFLASWLTRRVGFSPFVLGVSWMGVEFALASLGLRHALLAGTQGNSWFLHVLAQLLGYVFVAFLAAYVIASVVSALSDIRLGIPRQGYVTTSGDGATPLAPQMRLCFPLFYAVSPSQPRAPPAAPANAYVI